MKSILLLISFLLIDVQLQAQTATIIDENVLWIPAEPETNRFTISKSEVGKITLIQSEIGEVQSYSLFFKAGDIMYVKDMSNGNIQPKTKEFFLNSGAGTVLHITMKIKDKNTGAVVENTYEFILTFD